MWLLEAPAAFESLHLLQGPTATYMGACQLLLLADCDGRQRGYTSDQAARHMA